MELLTRSSGGSSSRDQQEIRDQLEEHFCKRLNDPGFDEDDKL